MNARAKAKQAREQINTFKRTCLEFAIENEMIIGLLSNEMFCAYGPDTIIDIDFESLENLVLNGFEIKEVLQNETNYRETV